MSAFQKGKQDVRFGVHQTVVAADTVLDQITFEGVSVYIHSDAGNDAEAPVDVYVQSENVESPVLLDQLFAGDSLLVDLVGQFVLSFATTDEVERTVYLQSIVKR